jgi:hypothetical protein
VEQLDSMQIAVLKEMGANGGATDSDHRTIKNQTCNFLQRMGYIDWLATGSRSHDNWTQWHFTAQGWGWYRGVCAIEKFEKEWENKPSVEVNHPHEGKIIIKYYHSGEIYVKFIDQGNEPKLLTPGDSLYGWAAKAFNMQSRTDIIKSMRRTIELLRATGRDDLIIPANDIIDNL